MDNNEREQLLNGLIGLGFCIGAVGFSFLIIKLILSITALGWFILMYTGIMLSIVSGALLKFNGD